MPVQQSKSTLIEKFGKRLNEAVEEAKKTEVKTGFVRLPGGIVNGIARLSKCYIGENDDGESYFRATGVVISPESVAVGGSMTPVKGLQTSIVVMVTDETFKKDLKKITDYLRALAGESVTEQMSGDNLEQLCEAVAEAKPYFRFGTRESEPVLNPDGSVKYQARVWEDWYGSKGLEDYVEPTATKSMPKDNTANGTVVTNGSTKSVTKSEPAETHGAAASEYRDDIDLDSLAKRARKDEDAENTLREMAYKLGYTSKDCDDADSWDDVAGWVKSGKKRGGTAAKKEEESGDEPVKPKRGEVYKYSPPNPAKKGKFLKECDVEVVSVGLIHKTATVKRTDDDETLYKDVPWDELTPTDE